MFLSKAVLTDAEKVRAENLPEKYRPFERRISSLWDLFDDSIGTSSWSPKITAWQRAQASTQEFVFQEESPQFCIAANDQNKEGFH